MPRTLTPALRRAAFAASFLLILSALPASAQDADILHRTVDELAAAINDQVVEWRRDIHANPELGMQEFRTAGLVAEHLESLGIEVATGVGGTGVVGTLRGARPGPVVALRADMDGLPVTELADVPFASQVTTTWQGREVGVMHACGHDNHVAILMGVASILAEMRDDLPGTVKFIFQPAEEGPGGAAPMLADGAFEDPRPDAVFGLHVFPSPAGTIMYRTGGMLASSDGLRIVVRGVQTHGAMPWAGVDPIATAAQIVVGLQTVVSRQVDLTDSPAIVTVGQIEGGNRGNIIPDTVLMIGTIRTLNPDTREMVHERVRRMAQNIAEANGAEAEVTIDLGYPVTVNDPALTRRMVPSLERVAGEGVVIMPPTTGAEDFSYFAEEVPGMFIGLGVGADDPALVHPNHSPYFYADERALPIGVRAMASLAVDFLSSNPISEDR
ncbi:MAG: amidohydrolase [Gemmatimonadetes bacterium]|nr:amidohydrolase [Gemmatimonadota bacterium]